MPDWVADHPIESREAADPHLAYVQRFPVKSLDPEEREQATLTTVGAPRRRPRVGHPRPRRNRALRPRCGRRRRFGRLRQREEDRRGPPALVPVRPREQGGPAVAIRRREADPDTSRIFPLYDGRSGENPATERDVHGDLNRWLSEYFDRQVSVRWDGNGQHDDRERHGPSVVSTATLREVAAWFDFDVESARRRFRANLELGGVPPFWEDQLVHRRGPGRPLPGR